MADLSTTYLGLQLRNPLVAASSPLTSSVEKIRELEQAGIGAVVLKSLFEEQISSESSEMMEGIYTGVHTDAYDFLRTKTREYAASRYLELIEAAKKAVAVPVIASLNCVSSGSWTEFASQIQAAGADAIELNVFILPADAKLSSEELEKRYITILDQVRSHVSIPVSMKIGSHFTALASVIRRLSDAGAAGLVLFNRFYRPDVDIERETLKAAAILSQPEETAVPLHWIALMSGELRCDLAASTGVWDDAAAIKHLLAGAKAVQLCSVLMKNGLGTVESILSGIGTWMDRKGYANIGAFGGKLCQERSGNPAAYERSQYIKALTGIA